MQQINKFEHLSHQNQLKNIRLEKLKIKFNKKNIYLGVRRRTLQPFQIQETLLIIVKFMSYLVVDKLLVPSLVFDDQKKGYNKTLDKERTN